MSDVNDGERDQLTVPAGVAGLDGVMYLHGLFPEAFLAEIDAAREDTPVTLASSNMYCDRRFLRDAALASRVLEHLPRELGFKHVLSDLRFLEYPPGGHILTHVDGVRRDDETNVDSTNSFLLFMASVPPGEGGETEFLAEANDDAEVLFGGRPVRGSVLVFPHGVPHRGQFVSSHAKVLLRGDLY
ncbi:uncharacterized protein MICPUCDRAFT_47019 [Micromonas pusilla CCMP1545]|jgi:hypothetical protein|uniref:Predicted protein n=1 Tax=Micromonas pusilla (strain CCMP1545) TaxID=564608 RepID=C1MQ86_MICPC|nr:uncharacterized protein MICPUCDRAFT_47019 [Micromonas pusilla CCMP1545]EEH57665.1 predicted protein [Micromonas pusilla CCMP1545]|tara:strand:+ start:98 stop:655 length:558 start_codon:yes stop_codon:yes gene_type:complete|mmetsp:Transcript_2777/g.8941  ORF Transcript_2777/g.8941 Transcript_2777/m.8941 type:complete len:186 (+) Transcript_2777:697-1254(+)|eukprot:XP_003057714.1 predicted protein [Micromonas pusilla CCMP1545]